MEGVILKGIGGFYYVDTAEGIVECKARGKFRQTVGKPIIGDRVQLSLQKDGTGFLTEIAPRRVSLVRPAVANVDRLLVVASAAPPATDLFMIDKMLSLGLCKGLSVRLLLNKTDLDAAEGLYSLYQRAGFSVIRVSAKTGEGMDALRQALQGHISAFAGHSGVGKSSLLNCLDCGALAQTGEISGRTGRGRHTTRHVELHPIGPNSYLADTPGFSSFETVQDEQILPEDLQAAFAEFAPFEGGCRFSGCTHIHEPDCAVQQAVREGKIAESRHQSYVKLYTAAKENQRRQISRGNTR